MTGEHWENVYRTKAVDDVSWYREHLDTSLALIDTCNLPMGEPVLDVGSGASTFADDLLRLGFEAITLVDLSSTALATIRNRLGDRASKVRFIESDILKAPLEESYFSLWHDRAVFHFLTDDLARASYVEKAWHSVKKGGHIIIGTFALDGPEKCSGLPVQRYAPADIASVFGLALLGAHREVHVTPWGSEQPFSYAVMER